MFYFVEPPYRPKPKMHDIKNFKIIIIVIKCNFIKLNKLILLILYIFNFKIERALLKSKNKHLLFINLVQILNFLNTKAFLFFQC